MVLSLSVSRKDRRMRCGNSQPKLYPRAWWLLISLLGKKYPYSYGQVITLKKNQSNKYPIDWDSTARPLFFCLYSPFCLSFRIQSIPPYGCSAPFFLSLLSLHSRSNAVACGSNFHRRFLSISSRSSRFHWLCPCAVLLLCVVLVSLFFILM